MPRIDIQVFYFAPGDFWNVTASDENGETLSDYSDTFDDKGRAVNDAESLAALLRHQGHYVVVLVEGNILETAA